MLVAVTLATGLCLYNFFIIYPSFSELLLQFTKNDTVRASHYLSATLQPDRALSEDVTLSPKLTRTLKRIEISMELTGLKLYSPSGVTLYSTWATDIGTRNNSEYFTSLTAGSLDTGNDDDLTFNPRKKYPFAIAVFNNSHEHHSYNSYPLKLSFK